MVSAIVVDLYAGGWRDQIERLSMVSRPQLNSGQIPPHSFRTHVNDLREIN
jgi:hypothetical protein